MRHKIMKFNIAKIASGVTAIGTGTLVGIHVAGLTTVVAGAAPAAGAIKTATVLTSSGPVVLSVVKASVASKVVAAIGGLALVSVLSLGVFILVEDLISRSKGKDSDKLRTATEVLTSGK